MEDDAALEVRRLRWQCRRGMLELDYLLERYLERSYTHATRPEREAFKRLLDMQDTELSAWLVTQTVQPDPEFSLIVSNILRPQF